MILEEIKNRTSESHEELERSSLMRPIGDKSITREGYVEILKRFYGFFQPLEDKIGHFPEIQTFLPDYATRRKAVALAADLQHFEKTASNSASLPICRDLPEINTTSQALGCLYVMEGSTLGGKMIARVLEETLGIDQHRGASFFYGYGPETGSKWKAFREALTAYAASSQEDENIIDAANETFTKFKNWLTV